MTSVPRWFRATAIWLTVTFCLTASAAAEPLRMGVESDLEPISFVDEKGAPAGFAIDLIKAIARETNLDVAFIVRPRIAMFDEFNQHKLDALANVVHTADRESYMAYAVSHLQLRATIFVRKDDDRLQVPADLRHLRIAGLAGSRGNEYLRENDLGTNFVAVPTQRDALHAVAEDRADATLGTRLLLHQILRDDPLPNLRISDVELPGLSYRFHIALQPEQRIALARINEGLARLRANGVYDQIYKKWIGPLEPRRLHFEDLQPYLLPAVLALATGLAALIWQRRLLQRLAAQTQALKESEERLTLVMEGSEDGFWDWDLRTGKIKRSERWASMLGYTLSEIEQTYNGWKRLVHPDDLPMYEDFEAELDAKSPDRFDVEYRMIAKSGECRWIHDRGKIVSRAPDGTPLRMAGTHTDITDRKRTEAALRESERLLKRSAQLLEQTQSAAHIGGWEIDLRGNRLFWSDETYRLHDLQPEGFQPTFEKAVDFFAGDDRAKFRTALELASRDGTAFDLQLELVTAKNRAICVRVLGRGELENARVVKVYGSLQDITDQRAAAAEREKLQTKMLDAQKLESLGVLAGGIAHDFNNLLTVILANASFARVAPGHAGALEERLSHIENAAGRAADMCRQLLAYAGQGSFAIDKVDLSTLVQDTAHLLNVSISKKARLELALASDLPLVNADPSQLRQVVMNLVINASEALSDAAGEIRLTTRRGRPEQNAEAVTHAFDLPPGDCVYLEVADTGSGMNAVTIARIFDPFFSTKFAGRGLGLAAVLGIVRAHRGALSVQSTIGRGSVFRLYLPAAPKSAPHPNGAPSPENTAVSRGTGTILIADDEPIVLSTTDVVLRHHGYQTALAADGAEALQLFRANPNGFAAVLLDLTMPGLDGAEVLREIRKINPAARVLLMSGYSEQDVIDRLRGQERVTVLRKPFTQQTLVTRVTEVATGL
jgi:two-component system cell cycle sensor histidine kinase/response regulator CckA